MKIKGVISNYIVVDSNDTLIRVITTTRAGCERWLKKYGLVKIKLSGTTVFVV